MTRKMKDSGIEWIGMIPEGWDVLKLKSSYSFGKGLSITKADLCEQGLGLISYGQIHSKDNIGASVRESLIRYLPFDHECLSDNSRVSINDIVFADTSEDLDGCGNCIFIDSENVKYAGYHTIILHPKTKETSRYFGYLFATDAWKTQIRENASGVKVYSITQDMLKNAYLLAPPIETQYQIVSFLDAKCAEIDALIAAKKKSNTLLKEYRQSIIFEAVTKGLDPNVLMKDSGIEWIGMIPEGWSVGRVKHYYHIVLGKMLQPNSKSETDELLPYMCAVNITWKGVDISTTKSMWFSKEERKNYKLHKGDLLVTEGGDVAVSCIWNDEIDDCYIQNAVHRVRPKGHGCNRFLYYWMTVLKKYGYINMVCNKATLAHFTKEKLEECIYIAPSQSEQIRIADYLDAKCAEIDVLIEANEKTINQLKEYRQSVIFEAVTGKMEV